MTTIRTQLKEFSAAMRTQADQRKASSGKRYYDGDAAIYDAFAESADGMSKVKKSATAKRSGQPAISDRNLEAWHKRLVDIQGQYETGSNTQLRSAEKDAVALGADIQKHLDYPATKNNLSVASRGLMHLERSMWQNPPGRAISRPDPIKDKRAKDFLTTMDRRNKRESDQLSQASRRRWEKMQQEMKTTPGGEQFLDISKRRLETALNPPGKDKTIFRASMPFGHWERAMAAWEYYKKGQHEHANEMLNNLNDGKLWQPGDQQTILSPEDYVKSQKPKVSTSIRRRKEPIETTMSKIEQGQRQQDVAVIKKQIRGEHKTRSRKSGTTATATATGKAKSVTVRMNKSK